MNVISLLLLGSLSIILVSALEAPSSQGVLAQTRLARDTNDSKKERRIKRRKSRRKKSNDKEAKSREKSRGRKKGRKAFKRNKDKKKKSKNNKKYNTDNSRNKRKKKRRKSKGKKKKNKGKSSISNPRSLVSPVPVPTPSPSPTGCPICPNCDATIIEKANGFKKAQNWLRQCKRIKSQTTVIGNKFGKAVDFMDAAKYLNMTTMGGTFCADGDSLANATATLTTLNECMASIEAACTCSTTVKQETKPPSSPSAAPTTAAATTPAPTTSACPDKETTLKGIVDSYQACLATKGSTLCYCMQDVTTPDPACNPGDTVGETKECFTKCKTAFGTCSRALKEAGPLVGKCCVMTTVAARRRDFLKRGRWI